MKQKIVNPSDGVYQATEDYVHALEVSGKTRQLFVSGTMGLAEDGKAPDQLDKQLELIWSNISRILHEADMTLANIVRITSYLGKTGYAERNQAARLHALGERRVPTTAIVVTTLDPSWLVEVEVVAMA